MTRLISRLCLPLATVLLLTQCDSKDPDSSEGSSESESSERVVRPRGTQSEGNQVQNHSRSGSVTSQSGSDPSSQVPQVPNGAPNETSPPILEGSEWEEQINALNQGMKSAIADGDSKALIRDFKAAGKLYGDSPSSSSAVLGDLLPELGGNLEMARSLIDSMDGDGMMTAISAHSIALTIEDPEKRKQWVQSLADSEVINELEKMLDGQ